MSSSFGILHNYDQPLYSPDLQLITTALSMKQEKLNSNRQKLQSLRDQFGALDVMKDVDANYLENRLQQVTDLTNQYAGGDLSDDGLARSLQANLSQVIDDNVKNAVLSTKLRRAENAEWDKMEKDKPELYSDLNRAYTSQSAQNWASDERVGVVYKGGGGFKAFDDVDKRMLKELPEAIKTLKDTWVETVPGSGMFHDIVTMEAVPRHEVENAMNMVIGQKGQEQLRINAWGANQGKSTEQLKSEYDGYFAPKIQELDNEIAKYQKTLATDKTLTSNEKIQTQEAIQRMQDNKNNMLGNSFDKVSAVDGVETAYTTLYTQQYKSGILDTYSYAPRIIERKIDENHKATVEFQHKLKREKVEDDHWDQKHALAITADYRAQKKFEAEITIDPNTGKATKKIAGGEVTIGKTQENTTPTIDQALARKQREETGAITGMKDLVEDILKKRLTSSQLLQLEGQIDLGKAINEVEIDGVKFQINTKSHFNTLHAFQSKVLNPSKTEKDIHDKITATGESLKWQLSKMTDAAYAGRGADFTPTELMNYQFMFQEDKSGKMVRVQTPKDSHMFARLLKMNGKDPKSLTEAQKLTLDTYINYSMASDPTVSKEMKSEIMSNMRQNVWKGVPTSAINGLPSEVGKLDVLVKNTGARWTTGVDENGEEVVTGGDKTFIGNMARPLSTMLKAKNMEYNNEAGDEVSFSSVGRQLENAFTIGMMGAESELGRSYKLASSSELIFTNEKAINDITGAPKGTPVTIEAKYNSEGKLTGEVNWSYWSGTGENRKQVTDNGDGSLTIDILKKNGIPFRNINRTEHNAVQKNAPTVELGNGYNKDEINNIRMQYNYEDSPFATDQYLPELMAEMNSYGRGAEIAPLIKGYTNGDYTFKIEPYSGEYYRSIYKGGNLMRRYPTGVSEYENDEIKELYQNSLVDNNGIFYKYINEKATQIRREEEAPLIGQ